MKVLGTHGRCTLSAIIFCSSGKYSLGGQMSVVLKVIDGDQLFIFFARFFDCFEEVGDTIPSDG